jgi:hypothetical protein
VKSRFLEEAKALAALDHANIVHLYNFGQENGSFILAMQFVQGQTWERMILANKRLDWKTSCRICVDVLRALEYAHGRGVVHRDMKPSNVLVRSHDGSATVMDFGIAKMTTSTRLTATGQTMGTVRYMSPEQVRGQEVDHKTDIYSLGATLYESLVGETPFDGSTHFEIMTKHLSEPPKRPSALGVEVPVSVEDALMRSLAKRADDRFGAAREMRKILEQALHAADPGLVETQKVNRELLGDIAAPKVKAPPSIEQIPTSRVATASELADELEPTTARPIRKRARRSKLPWIVLAVMILAGGGVIAAKLVLDKRAATVAQDGPFPELGLKPAVTIGDLSIVTDGTVDPEALARRYRDEVERVQQRVDAGLAAAKQPPIKLEPVHELYAVPQSALCMKSAYTDDSPCPNDCASVAFVHTIGDRSPTGINATAPRLYLVNSRLDVAISGGVARAACLAAYDKSNTARTNQICDLVEARVPRPK